MSKNQDSSRPDIPAIQKIIAVLWPSFLVAGFETIIIFTLFDPSQAFMGYDVTEMTAYSIGFFMFWGFTLLTSILTLYFIRPCKPCAVYKDEIEGKR